MFMAGYVVVKLLKKYSERSLYTKVLETMKTNLEESSVVLLRVWVEQRGRGGLNLPC